MLKVLMTIGVPFGSKGAPIKLLPIDGKITPAEQDIKIPDDVEGTVSDDEMTQWSDTEYDDSVSDEELSGGGDEDVRDDAREPQEDSYNPLLRTPGFVIKENTDTSNYLEFIEKKRI